MADSPAPAAAAAAEPAAPATQQDDVTITQQARSILRTTRDTEFLHSFLRVDHGDSDSEAGDAPRLPGPGAPTQKDSGGDGDGGGEGGRRGAAADRHEETSSRRHHKATFKEVVKDLEMYGGLGALAAIRGKGGKGRRNRVIRGEEVYTDKDRAAAVQMGHRDIKQSLRLKRHQERVHALQLPEEADGSTLLALGQYELRQGNIDIAIAFVNKALQLCPEDKTALVARSKCYLLLGQPRLALQDAETALEPDRNFVRAIFQKAEALYHMGDFEHSLMYYHRGLRLRPELAVFRLGVQKAQEAIENTIGRSKGSMRAKVASSPGSARRSSVTSPAVAAASADAAASPAASPVPGIPALVTQPTLTTPGSARSRASRSSRSSQSHRHLSHSPSSTDGEEQSARRLLGELCVDKLYLEQLLKHPDIRCARKDRSSQIAEHAEDGVEFLRNRQEFWRQQKLSTGPGGISVSRSTARRKPATPTANNNASSTNSSARNSARASRPATASLQAVA